MKECLIRNLADGPRDYPMADGSSVYLGSKGRAERIARIPVEQISEAMRIAESKNLLAIEEIADVKDCIVKNLADGPRDYPMADGSSVYLGSEGDSTESARVPAENVSEAMRIAEGKNLLAVEEADDDDDDDYGYYGWEGE